jgi:hypothetical protein
MSAVGAEDIEGYDPDVLAELDGVEAGEEN